MGRALAEDLCLVIKWFSLSLKRISTVNVAIKTLHENAELRNRIRGVGGQQKSLVFEGRWSAAIR
jgi:hypothetical protein